MQSRLDTLFRPASVAIVGASSSPGRLTGRPLRILRQHGFEGEIAVVHPRVAEIDGVPAYRSIAEVPFVPDVVLVMVRAELVPALAAECAEKGVRHLVVLSSGFEETQGGAGLSAELARISAEHGMGIVGPNSEGLWFLPGRSILTFGSAAMREDLVSGPVAVLSQSGSIGASVMRQLNESGVGADVFVSLGNETVLGAADYLDWVVSHTEVRVVVCFLEGLRDGRGFLEAASRGRDAGVTVVALKAGSSDEGRLASASHTGKISSSGVVYESLLRQAGVIQVESVDQLAGAAAVLSGRDLPDSAVPGAGLTVIGLSGGSRSIIADAAEARGVPLARLSAETSAELATFIPDFGVTTNPVDPTGQVLSDPELFPRTIHALAEDPHTRVLLVQYANGGVGVLEQHLPVLRAAAEAAALPMVVSCLLDQLPADHAVRRELAAAGLAYAHDPAQAVHLASLLFQRGSTRWPGPVLPTTPAEDDRAVVDWASAANLVSGAGLHVPAQVVLPASAATADLAGALAAGRIGYPVVVKPSPDDVAHKSELGLVFLGLGSLAEVEDAARRIGDDLGGRARVVVQEQVPSGPELLVVLQQDPDFGPIMGIGLGGYFVELMAEVSYVALPATPAQVDAALDATRVSRMLAGYRAAGSVDRAAVAEQLVALGSAYAGLKEPPRLLELNPLVARPDGGLVAIDALVESGAGADGTGAFP
jgi:acyl-CoA synthetase (NDP forming)